ncbi:MAG: hypothetical protein EAZ92_17385 [Candidatus Kapaibacterium sp.]|nr:MAG: hypothetical protein EAZ92_17385 [Candidatus Kapabacteria bacterium]
MKQISGKIFKDKPPPKPYIYLLLGIFYNAKNPSEISPQVNLFIQKIFTFLKNICACLLTL